MGGETLVPLLVRSRALPVALPSRVAVLVALAAMLSAVGLSVSAAEGATVFMHSAKRGELKAGRLLLHGVRGRVTWARDDGRSGVVAVKRLHRRVFMPGVPHATGTLHVAGHRGGDEPAFRLTRPRYSAARRTVSYRARRIRRGGRSRRSAGAAQTSAPRQFGAASLSIVPHAQVTGGDNGGNDCPLGFVNETGYGVKQVSHSNWDSDSWNPQIPDGTIVTSHSQSLTPGSDLHAFWESDAGLWRGCSNSATWELVVDPNEPTQAPPPAGVRFTLSFTWPWSSVAAPSCTSTSAQFYCVPTTEQNVFLLRGPVPCCPRTTTARRR